LGATLQQELGIHADLVKGERGAFEIVADGTLVFSKHAQGRFPEDREIVDPLRRMLNEGARPGP
jgi:selT/selW/selH-like putative selenoprotein